MRDLLRKLASLKLTFAGLAWLVLHSVAVSQWPEQMIPWLVLPLALLALNLLAAILVNRNFRTQGALLLFHIGLLGIVVLVAAGILVRFDGQVEIIEGQDFDPAAVRVRNAGLLHRDALGAVEFRQGPIEVNYVSGLRRGTTHSTLALPGGNEKTIGDRRVHSAGDYRFKATFNKGFSLPLLWQGDDGTEMLGAVNFPSYPEFEWKQQNDWTTPTGEPLVLDLVLRSQVPDEQPWTLTSRDVDFDVVVRRRNGETVTLGPGESLDVDGGRITNSELRLWMGYRIDSNPFLPWLITAAFLSLGALTAHVQRKFRPGRSSRDVSAVGQGAEA
jgi:cytochrome c biogenesis protein